MSISLSSVTACQLSTGLAIFFLGFPQFKAERFLTDRLPVLLKEIFRLMGCLFGGNCSSLLVSAEFSTYIVLCPMDNV